MQASETNSAREPFDRNAGRKPARLSINGDLLQKAHDLGIDLTATLEEALVAQILRQQRESWREENREAIAAYNDLVVRQGVWNDGLRSF